MIHRRYAIILPLLLAGIAARAAPTPLECPSIAKPEWDASQRAAALADCEFYNSSLQKGAESWVDFAAPNVAMADARGKDELRAVIAKRYSQPGFSLVWKVDRAEKFGQQFVITSGRWEIRQAGELARGRYVTVWRKQPDGNWRFVWDGGETDPSPPR
jgi:ketosteroid isomerase-like protein